VIAGGKVPIGKGPDGEHGRYNVSISGYGGVMGVPFAPQGGRAYELKEEGAGEAPANAMMAFWK